MSRPSPPVRDAAGSSLRGWYERLDSAAVSHSDWIAAALLAAGFFWRVWLAQATFFNTDEAWHYSVANQNSLGAVYRASLTLAHPPLMVLVLYLWRPLGASDVMIRLPGVLAGTVFCWIFYKWLDRLFGRAVAWCGLIFSAFLPPMIVLSEEVRQYSWLLMFAVTSAYFLEKALDQDSARWMWLSSVCLWLAMASHYSAFLFAAGLAGYALFRTIDRPPAAAVMASWGTGQVAGVGLAVFLYKSHVARLAAVYPGDPLRRFGDFYLSDVYFHPGKENLLHFLYRGTFGVFRFICAQRTAGHLATVLFVAGIVLLFRGGREPDAQRRNRLLSLFLILPFLINWIAVVAGFYPYGRTRQCVFLAIFGLAGVSISLVRIAGRRVSMAAVLAGVVVAMCHLFGTPHSLDMLAVAEQRHEHMEQAIDFIRKEVSPAEVLFTDKPTSFQLMHYLCGAKPVSVAQSGSGFESLDCNGIRLISTDLSEGSLTSQSLPRKLQEMERNYGLTPPTGVWVVQGAWSTGLGEKLREQSPEFSGIEPRGFDRYLEVFRVPRSMPSAVVPAAR